MKKNQPVLTLFLLLLPNAVPYNPFETFFHLFFRWGAEGVFIEGCSYSRGCSAQHAWPFARKPLFRDHPKTTAKPKQPHDVIRFPAISRDVIFTPITPDYKKTWRSPAASTEKAPTLPVRGYGAHGPWVEENEIPGTSTQRVFTPPPPIYRPGTQTDRPTESTTNPTKKFTPPPPILRKTTTNTPAEVPIFKKEISQSRPGRFGTNQSANGKWEKTAGKSQSDTNSENFGQSQAAFEPSLPDRVDISSQSDQGILEASESEVTNQRPLISWEASRPTRKSSSATTRGLSTTLPPVLRSKERPRNGYEIVLENWDKPNTHTSPVPLRNIAD